METRVISRIAQELFYTTSNTPEALRRSKHIRTQAIRRTPKSSSDYLIDIRRSGEKGEAHGPEVRQMRENVSAGRYDLDQKVIQKIAEKIVQMLV